MKASLAAGFAVLLGLVSVPAQERAGDKPLSEWLQALAGKDAGVRAQAAEAIGRMGPEAKTALPQLAERLKDENPLVRVQAALALWRIDRAAIQDVLPVLLAARRDPDDKVRAVAAEALRPIGPGVRTAMPWLMETLKRTDYVPPQTEQKAVQTLAPFGLEAVPALLDALESSYVPPPAAGSPSSPSDVDYRLMEQARGEGQARNRLRNLLAQVLGKIGRPAVPTLIELLVDRDPLVRWSAADALAGLGPAARPALARSPRPCAIATPPCACGRSTLSASSPGTRRRPRRS